MNLHRRHRGYILLLTLVLLALAAIALASLCRASLRASVAASRAAEELQMRWADLSCRFVFLPRAEAILAAAETTAGRPVASERVQVVLGNVIFDLVFGDEQAKPNVTVLGDRRGGGEVERVAHAAAGGRLRVYLRPMVRPSTDPKRAGATVRVFGSFGQIYDGGEPQDLLAAGRGLTCWGSGRLNWRRASAAALAEMGAPVLTPHDVQALFAARRNSPEKTFAQVLTGGLNADRAIAINSLLTDVSACHSLWISASIIEPASEDAKAPPRAGRYSLTIEDSADSNQRPVSFSW